MLTARGVDKDTHLRFLRAFKSISKSTLPLYFLNPLILVLRTRSSKALMITAVLVFWCESFIALTRSMVEQSGIEPPTPTLRTWCSTN